MSNVAIPYRIASPIFTTHRSYGASYIRDAAHDARLRTLALHIAAGDYFSTLSTVMALMADLLSSEDKVAKKRCIEILKELREELLYLERTHRITRK